MAPTYVVPGLLTLKSRMLKVTIHGIVSETETAL